MGQSVFLVSTDADVVVRVVNFVCACAKLLASARRASDHYGHQVHHHNHNWNIASDRAATERRVVVVAVLEDSVRTLAHL